MESAAGSKTGCVFICMNKPENIFQDTGLVLVDFYAEWCEPCKWVEPILDQVKEAIKGELEIVKIDIDKNPGLKDEFQVQSVPTLAIFKNGEILWRMAGFCTAPELIKIVKHYLL